MKIAVVGPGALGLLIAASIRNRTKEDVWLIDKYKDRAKKIAESGIRVEGPSGAGFTVKVNVTADPKEAGVCGLVIICVKSYSTEEACKEIKDIVSDETSVLTLQNGIGNVQILNDYFGQERVVAGVTNHGSTLIGVGHVKHAGKGDTIIGKADGRLTLALKDISRLLTKAGIETRISKDVDSVIWSKLIINAGINALTAITRLNNGMLVEFDGTRELMCSAVGEAVKIVKRKRIKLTYDDPIQKAESVCKSTANNVSSMLQDILKKDRTEIDYINGAIVRHGKALGIATPANEVLTNLIKAIESSYDKVVSYK